MKPITSRTSLVVLSDIERLFVSVEEYFQNNTPIIRSLQSKDIDELENISPNGVTKKHEKKIQILQQAEVFIADPGLLSRVLHHLNLNTIQVRRNNIFWRDGWWNNTDM